MIIGTVHSKSVGKTTLAVHLAGWLHLYGYDVAIIDADWQKQCSSWLADAVPEIPCFQTSEPEEIEALSGELIEKHNIVIIDGPAGLHLTPGAVLTVSDVVIVPCGPTATEIKALSMVADTIREIQAIRSDESPTAVPFPIIVPVKTATRTIATQALLEEASKLGFQSTKHTIPFSQPYACLMGLGDEPARLMWQLGRSKKVKEAVMNLHALFQEMFPEAAEHDAKLVERMMKKPLPRKRKKPTIEEEHEHRAVAANA